MDPGQFNKMMTLYILHKKYNVTIKQKSTLMEALLKWLFQEMAYLWPTAGSNPT